MTIVKIFAVTAMAAVALLGADSSPSPSPSPSAAASAAPAVVVHIKNFVYVPKVAKIHVGDTVQFINDDANAHTVSADDKSYDSGDMQQSATWSYKYTKSGTTKYNCAYHAFMHGSVEVAP